MVDLSDLRMRDVLVGAVTTAGIVIVHAFICLFGYPSTKAIVALATAPLNPKKVTGDADKTTVYGFQGPSGHVEYGLLDESNYVAYVEMYLRMTGVDYVKKPSLPMINPRGKLPVAVVGGQSLDDSARIVAAVKKWTGKDLDAGLTDEQKITGHLITNTLNGSLYWTALYGNFCTDKGRRGFVEHLKKGLPAPIVPLVAASVFRGFHSSLMGVGTARYPPAEIFAKGMEDMKVLEAMFPNKSEYLFGSEPTSYDALLYSYVALMHKPSHGISEAKSFCPKLVAFEKRVQAKYLADLKAEG